MGVPGQGSVRTNMDMVWRRSWSTHSCYHAQSLVPSAPMKGHWGKEKGLREVSGLPAESAWPLSPKDLDSFTLGCYGYMPAQDLHWLAEEVLNEFCFPCSKDSSLQIVWPDKLIKTFHFLYFTDSVQRISSCGCCRFSCICVLVFVFFLYVQAYWH